MMPASERPLRVAVVGGGCAGMAAAFELTRPEHAGRYEVTVYQVGWRLGGKGASGRGAADRIEEHGLHLWMGWYHNAFRLMRDCYEELGRDPERCPLAGWRDAFTPYPYVGVMERTPEGDWSPWAYFLPSDPGLPGDPYTERPPFTMADYMTRGAALVRTLLDALVERAPGEAVSRDGLSTGVDTSPEGLVDLARRLTRYGEVATLAALAQSASVLESAFARVASYPDSVLLRFVDAVSRNAREQLGALTRSDPEARRLWTILDLTMATMRGALRFGLLTDPRGFDAIDDYECREWLLLNGASRESVESGWVRGLYDLVFAYEDGDPERPAMAAGQALRSMIRAFFTYRGSFFWKMEAGMGDVVFAPLYEVLRRRGARFEFFHRLENVGISDRSQLAAGERPHVEALEFDVQARVRGDAEYEPLVDVGGLPCWPSQPDFGQLVEGEMQRREGWNFESFWDARKVATKTLRVGEHFDVVVLGVGVGAVPFVCRKLVESDPRWRAMVNHVKTVATQAFQVWLRTDMKELGWLDPPASLSGFVEPFDTWADMRHLLAQERWPVEPRALAYFCNALPEAGDPAPREDAAYPERQREEVRRNAIRFLNRDVVKLWPRAEHVPGRFRWDLLVDPAEKPEDATMDREEGAGELRFDTQFWTANVNPSDRYALSLPGSLVHRISPLDYTYDNLTVAGDWTACGFNAGCVEAAVMSGLLAAHAIARSPRLEDIIGYDHP